MAEDMGEKTELPSSRKLSEARSRGQVAKSQELAAAIDLSAAVLLLVIFGGSVVRTMAAVMRRVLANPAEALDPSAMGRLVLNTAWESIKVVAPVLGLMAVVAAGSHIVQFGLLFTTHPLQPNLRRLNPISGFGRLFGKRNMVRTLSGLVRITLVGAVAWAYVEDCLPTFATLPLLPVSQAAAVVGRILLELALWALAVLLVLGAADYLYQRWQHTQDLKMTKEEVKDERRSMEGDPAVKGRRYKLMREMAMQRVSAAVPKADVIVTNPTHYAVAIQYDQATMRAPRVVAKGVDHMAMRIRHLALIHKIPIVERPPLARALYAGVEVGQEISTEFYQAIAEVLAYVYRLENKAA
jgi:flagellar biosynthetic protein FlhB